MTDIVERLRLYDKRLIDVHLAADEIEWLTKLLALAEDAMRGYKMMCELQASLPSCPVLAERERCAKIAETTEREGFGGGAYNEAGRDIAKAIREKTDR